MSHLRTSLIAATTALAATAAATPAQAWTVKNDAGSQTVTFTAAAGELNAPTVERVGNANDVLRFRDAGGPAGAASLCDASAELQFAQCVAGNQTRLVFLLGDRSETLLLGTTTSGIARVDLDGGDGNDTLSNLDRPGTLKGGAGSDVLRPGLGTDTVAGGSGLDAVDYSERMTPLVIDTRLLNGQIVGRSGAPGENDALSPDIEAVFGGAAADVINTGEADDQVIPNKGKDEVSTASGDDVVDARDGVADKIFCGTGTDTVYADQLDSVAVDCDTVTRTTVAVGLAPVGGGAPPAPPAPPAEAPIDPAQPPADGTPAPAPTPEPGGTPVAPDTRRPTVSALKLSRWTIGLAGPRTRTTLGFTVSEPVSVTVAVRRVAAGRRSGAKCVMPTATLVRRKAKPCVRTVAVTTLKRTGLDGEVGLRLTARPGTKTLKVGRYRLTVVATDLAGNRSAATSTTLKVVRR
jgi:hypothetical protein